MWATHPPVFGLESLLHFIWGPTFLGESVVHLVGQEPAGGGLGLEEADLARHAPPRTCPGRLEMRGDCVAPR